MDIIPAILPLDFEELQDKMALVSKHVSLVQIDVCDGIFVPKKSWPYVTSNPDGDFQNIILEKQGFPFWDQLDFEAHLMVVEPENKIQDWINAGASRLIIHFESTKDLSGLLKNSRSLSQLSQGGLSGIEIGLALNITTDIETIKPYLNEVDLVQFMGIAEIGFQGQPFDERVISRIAKLRESHPETIISVDGGVSLENAPALVRAGANRLVVGSAIFESDNISETIKAFREIKI